MTEIRNLLNNALISIEMLNHVNGGTTENPSMSMEDYKLSVDRVMQAWCEVLDELNELNDRLPRIINEMQARIGI